MARSLDHFGYCSCGGRKQKKISLDVVRNKAWKQMLLKKVISFHFNMKYFWKRWRQNQYCSLRMDFNPLHCTYFKIPNKHVHCTHQFEKKNGVYEKCMLVWCFLNLSGEKSTLLFFKVNKKEKEGYWDTDKMICCCFSNCRLLCFLGEE